MTPEQKKSFNTGVGGLFFGLGGIAWLLTLYFSLTPATPRPAPVLQSVVDMGSCRTTLSKMGYSVVERSGKLEVRQETFDSDARGQLEKATLAASVCKLTMEKFCMGESCEVKGVSMTLAAPFGGNGKKNVSAPATSAPAAAKPKK